MCYAGSFLTQWQRNILHVMKDCGGVSGCICSKTIAQCVNWLQYILCGRQGFFRKQAHPSLLLCWQGQFLADLLMMNWTQFTVFSSGSGIVLLMVVGWEWEKRFCGVSISHSPRSKAVAHFILNAYSGQYICMDVWHVNLMGGGSIHCQWLCTHQSQLFFTSNINEREIICHISSFHGFSSFLVQLWQLLLLLTCSHWLYKESDWLKTGLTGVFCSSMLWKQSLPYIFEWEIKCNPQLKSAIRTKFHHTSFNLLRKKMTRRNMMLHPLMLT